jgi:hypothetical protein
MAKYLTKPEMREVMLWMINGKVGQSSKTLACAACGVWVSNQIHYPYDVDDFSRCYFLIEQIPNVRKGVDELATACYVWEQYAKHWDEMTELYKRGIPNQCWLPLRRLIDKLRELAEINRKEGRRLNG